jgi:hypothetical protein
MVALNVNVGADAFLARGMRASVDEAESYDAAMLRAQPAALIATLVALAGACSEEGTILPAADAAGAADASTPATEAGTPDATFVDAVTRGPAFAKLTLDTAFRTEGVAVFEVDRDGRLDVVTDRAWYAGPTFAVHAIRAAASFDPAASYRSADPSRGVRRSPGASLRSRTLGQSLGARGSSATPRFPCEAGRRGRSREPFSSSAPFAVGPHELGEGACTHVCFGGSVVLGWHAPRRPSSLRARPAATAEARSKAGTRRRRPVRTEAHRAWTRRGRTTRHRRVSMAEARLRPDPRARRRW